MFNEFQKMRYLESPQFRFEDSSKEVIKRIFEIAGNFESFKDEDLSKFNRPQVIDLLKGYNSHSKMYLRLISGYFSDYYNWCLSEGLVDNTNVTNYYDYSITKTIIDELIPLELVEDKYFLRETVLEYKDKVLDPVNQFVLYAPFCGVLGNDWEDLSHAKLSDLDEENKTFKLYSGITINVDEMFIKLIKKADAATEYTPQGESGRVTKKNVYDSSCYVIKTCNMNRTDTPVTNIIMFNRMRVIQKQANNAFITGRNIYNNGLINYIKEKFEERNISLKQALFNKKNTYEYIYAKEVQQYINEFGSQITDRMLRMLIKEVIDLFE